jgi:hypothetical protein
LSIAIISKAYRSIVKRTASVRVRPDYANSLAIGIIAKGCYVDSATERAIDGDQIADVVVSVSGGCRERPVS